MNLLGQKSKKLLTILAIVVSLTLVLTSIQSNFLSVSAQVIPVVVSIDHLDFGTVFPGENHDGNFIVEYVDDGEGINYQIVQKRKPLPEEHPEYPDGGDPDMPGYYRNLCPYLTKVSEENEGDIEEDSFVGPNDLTDEWTIYFSVPAILGNVAQDHDGGIVTVNGEYGCDITIELDEFCGDGVVNLDEECDDGNDINNDTCTNECTFYDCRTDLDVVIVMDTSGSMNWDSPTRISQAKTAANDFINNLEANDQSALVSYNFAATLDKTLSNSHASTTAAINSLSAGGATNIGDAIDTANNELTGGNANPQAAKIEILLTDGKANKPNGPGYGENALDVAFAEAKANEAAGQGIRIFTIGLGNNVNAAMLENIASSTGATYHFAPGGSDLEDIFNLIAMELCVQGSISGCKYEDSNNDGDITGEETIPGWRIILSGDKEATKLTGEDGCYTFANLLPGEYTVYESSEQDAKFIQTYPTPTVYNITLRHSEFATGYDFGNYTAQCRADLDVIIVMDTSGSMGWDSPTRISQAKLAADDFISKLETNDQSGLVSYDFTATLDKTLSNSHASTTSAIDSLSAGGATNIGDAIDAANNELTGGNVNPNANKIEILLTDGKANKPNGPGYGENALDVAYAEAMASSSAALGIKIFTIGLGANVNATMLQNIASSTGALYYFAPTGNDLEKIFTLISEEFCQ